ncbi:MAG: T9SS type A sorting domain-containing protein, partial [Bacteroidia bacterium]
VSLRSSGAIVAGGIFKTGVATGASGWQQATVNLTYISGATPDTIYVLFSASSLDHTPKPGSVLWIDDVSVTLPAGIDDIAGSSTIFSVFPNPSGGNFFIKQKNGKLLKQTIQIYNSLGEKIIERINEKQETCGIDISGYPKGIYFVKVYDGEKFQTEKIIIE